MAHAHMEIIDGCLKITKPGTHKFIDKVLEITMSGKQAMKKRKNVLYVTNVGIFKLTDEGMTIIEVMPGVDIEKDIVNDCPMRVVLPKEGTVPVTPSDIVTGKNFKLSWQ